MGNLDPKARRGSPENSTPTCESRDSGGLSRLSIGTIASGEARVPVNLSYRGDLTGPKGRVSGPMRSRGLTCVGLFAGFTACVVAGLTAGLAANFTQERQSLFKEFLEFAN